MAQNPAPGVALSAASSFTITLPGVEASVTLHSGNTITVEVDDTGAHDAFDAAIYDVCVGSASAPTIQHCVPLTHISGNTWRGEINVGFLDPFDILQAMKNVIVYGTIINGGEPPFAKTRCFRIDRGGSGSMSGSGSGIGIQRPCGFCSAQPVPVCLRVINAGAAISNDQCTLCAALNANFTLQHSDDPCFSCCWFSGPIDFCGNGSIGYWKLEKISATRWELGVWYSESGSTSFPIVLYGLDTAPNVCTFPITLALVAGQADDACSNWPATIRVEAAP